MQELCAWPGNHRPLRRELSGARTLRRRGSLAEPHEAPLRTRVYQGAVLAIVLTAVRLALDPHALTGLSTVQVTLLVGAIAVAGAVAGGGYYVTDGLRAAGGWRRTSANVVALLAFCALACAIVVVLF